MEPGAQLTQSQSASSQQCPEQTLVVSKEDTGRRSMRLNSLLNVRPGAASRRPCMLSRFICVQLLVIPWPVAHQVPLSKGFSRQEYWSGLPFPSPGDLPDARVEPVSLASPALAGGFCTASAACGWSLFPGHPAPAFEREDSLDREKRSTARPSKPVYQESPLDREEVKPVHPKGNQP